MEKSAGYFLVIEAYQSPYPDPIIFHAGEEVTVGKEFSEDPDWVDWVWCEGQRNKKAWAPKQFLEMDVTLTMKDGSQIHTIEPQIDAIFAEIDQCGQPCSQIALATE